MNFKKQVLVLLAFTLHLTLVAQPLNLIPKPSTVTVQPSLYNTALACNINYHVVNQNIVAAYTNFFKPRATSFNKQLPKTKAPNTLVVTEVNTEVADMYLITMNANIISITGSARALYYALQTLTQIFAQAQDGLVQCYNITDAPRFAYRGMHLDVARHFYTVAEVKKYIDYLAMYKYNTLHWHLTDDQGWRIEIKKYPLLTKIGATRNGTIQGRYPGTGNTNVAYGGYYTQAQIKEVVAYATKKFITIIPEIEMPGHASAAIAAYPLLSCNPDTPTHIPGKYIATASLKTNKKLVQETWGVFPDVFIPTEYTFTFLQNVLDEVMQLFPSKYIHIGGDECPKKAWKESPFCQKLMKQKGLKSEHELQSYFVQRIEKYLNSKRRSIIGWDEILEGGLAPNATVMSWRGEKGGIEAAQQGHQVIMTPSTHVYFDHAQLKEGDSLTIGGYTSVQKVYSYEPVPAMLTLEQAKLVLGAQANVWTEYITNFTKVEYMIFPRMIALSEVLWSSPKQRDWNDFEPRLMTHLTTLQKLGINYCNSMRN